MADPELAKPRLGPVRKTIVVRRTPDEAFAVFTQRFGAWWPYTQFSLGEEETAECGFEPRLGGELYERSRTGERSRWGSVRAWEPPHRFVLAWHPGRDPAEATEVEVRFEPVAGGTRVTLEHRGWEALGAKAAESREGYEKGWVAVFETRYAQACA
jgi:uncharacterized protein YndB with AHSA1/START domain